MMSLIMARKSNCCSNEGLSCLGLKLKEIAVGFWMLIERRRLGCMEEN